MHLDLSLTSLHRLLRRAAALAAISACLLASAHAGRVSLQGIHRSVLPLVSLSEKDGDYELLGNVVLLDDAGHAVTPASLLRRIPASVFLPSPRLGVLLPREVTPPDAPVSETSIFARIEMKEIDDSRDLALVRVLGPLFKALPLVPGGDLRQGDERHMFGYGAPGIASYLFRADVTAVLPARSISPSAHRYALDANATEAASGGALFDRASGKISGVVVFHLRNVHRVVTKQADFEYGPVGTCLAIPIAEVRAWADERRSPPPPPGGEPAGPSAITTE